MNRYRNRLQFLMYIVNYRMQTPSAAAPKTVSIVRTWRCCPFILCILLSLSLVSSSQAATAKNSAWALAESNPAELMRQAAQNELANSYGHRSPLRYSLRKITAKSDTTKEIVETSNGGVARLIAIGGHPLSASQQQLEIERLHAIAANPEIEAHRRRNELRDAERIRKFTRLLSDAFVYQLSDSVETAHPGTVQLSFAPNPKFTPPDFESRILTGIRGNVWIDSEDLRVVRIQGRIFKTVDFGWGIIGSLYPGATIQIEQSQTADCGWQLAHLSLHLEGKALMFKSLHIVVEESADNYQPVPPRWNYQDAVQWLLQMPAAPTPALSNQ